MKFSELNYSQLCTLAYKRPDWMADIRPVWRADIDIPDEFINLF